MPEENINITKVLEITKKCGDTLKKHKRDNQNIANILIDHFAAKKEYMERLQLTDENNWRNKFQIEFSPESKPEAQCFLSELERVSDGKYKYADTLGLMKNGKNQIKVGKIITELFPKLIEGKKLAYFKWFLDQAKVDLLKDAREKQISKLSCFYGDYIKGNRTAVISGNPWDFLTASGGGYATFSSCVAIDNGGQFGTLINYLHSPNTFITYIEDKKKEDVKIGRAMIYMNNHIVAISRLFGNMYGSDADLVAKKIQECFPEVKWKKKEYLHVGNVVLTNMHGYVDTAYGNIWISDKLPVTKTTGVPNEVKIRLSSGFCLICGKRTKLSPSGLCKTCYETKKDVPETRCGMCGCTTYIEKFEIIEDNIIKPKVIKNEKELLETIMNTKPMTKKTIEATPTYAQGIDGVLCKKCADKNTFKCPQCGDIVITGHRVNIKTEKEKTISVCNHCNFENNNTTSCQKCNHIIYKDDAVYIKSSSTQTKKVSYCKDCITDLFKRKELKKCKICGETFYQECTAIGKTKEGKKITACFDCFKKEELKEIPIPKKKPSKVKNANAFDYDFIKMNWNEVNR